VYYIPRETYFCSDYYAPERNLWLSTLDTEFDLFSNTTITTKMKHFYSILLFAILLGQTSVYGQKDWTLLVYIVGSDLESGSDAATADIQEMLSAGATSNVNVVYLTGGANKDGWRTSSSWVAADGQETQQSFIASNTNMATESNITEFINWGTSTYPATKTMLTFWNHGGDIRGYGFDEVSNQQLTVPKIQSAIANSDFIKGGGKFEVIGFDACLMATLEVQSAVAPFAKYFVGSEETEPGHGWDYVPLIQSMESMQDGAALGTTIVDGYKAQSEAEETQNVTLGVMDLSKIPDVVASLETLFNKVKADSKIRSLQQARGKAEEYSKSIKTPEYSEDMVDIGDLMKKLKVVDPTLAAEADAVLAAVTSAVLHNKKDMTRPLATGISLYLPHNVLVDEDETYNLLDNTYYPLDFSESIKNFVNDTYVPMAHSDDTPPSGEEDPFTFDDPARSAGNTSAIRISHDDDLEQVQVVLIEEFAEYPNEFILLGSSYPDTMILNADGSETYAYRWDEHWLGIDGYPAYVSDIHDFEVDGKSYTRIHIPAIQNPGTEEERDIIIAYRFDEDFNHELESIVPEVYGDSVMVIAKERIELQPGEQIQLLYEGFNEVTDEEFFVINEGEIIDIVNGNEDLHLEYDQLEVGTYHIGYLLMDHSQNDTIIFDRDVFEVSATSVVEGFLENDIKMYPNPANPNLTLEFEDFKDHFTVILTDMSGRRSFKQKFSNPTVSINTSNLSSGLYTIEIISGRKKYTDELIIQH